MTATADNLATALALAAQGFAVFPCQSAGGPDHEKRPVPFFKWRDRSTCDEGQIREFWRRWPTSIPAIDLAKVGLLVIDADRHEVDKDGVEAFGQLMVANGFDPDSAPLVATPNQGNHHYFRQPTGKLLGNGEGAMPPGINVRGHGGYVIAPGAIMADGRSYELFGDLAAAPVAPEWLVSILEARREPARTVAAIAPHGSVGGSEIEDLLSFIPADCGYHDWVAVLMAIHAATGGSGEGLSIADAWSARGGSKYPGSKALAKKWASFRSAGITMATLADLARSHGADLAAIALRHGSSANTGETPEEMAAVARRLIQAHDGTVADAETGEVVEERPSELPTPSMQFPPGLVGDIAQWITDTARRPQPELALGAALAIVGTVAGRQFCGPTRSGTHLYVLGLAPTGTGKDHALQAIGRVLSAAKLGQHLGPSEFISMPAVVNFLTRKPLSLCPMDEFGSFMKRINSKRASGFEGAIAKVIRTMWSSSFAPYFTPEWAQKASETIYCPAMSLYGASTPEQFYSAMEGASAEDGTLNRFLLVNGRQRPAEVDPEYDPAVVPDVLTDALRRIYMRSGELAVTYRNDPLTDPAATGRVVMLQFCADGSHKRYKAFSAEVEAIIQSDPDRAPFFARSAEMALRIATIVAIGRLDDDQVRVGDLEFGISIARQSAETMSAGAADYMSDNENQANARRVIRILRARGGRLKWRDLLRALQNAIRPRDLKDLLAQMHDAGQVERQEVKPPSGPSTFWYQLLE